MSRVIHNFFASDNHFNRMRQLFEVSTDVLIASPFLMRDLSSFFAEIDLTNMKSLTLVTTLKPQNIDQINKTESFISLMDFLHKYSPHTKLSLNINNRLHGKVYLFKNNNEFVNGIVTSANFTEAGLGYNHEWGVEISDKSQLIDLQNSLYGSVEYRDLTEDVVLQMLIDVEEYLKEHPAKKLGEIDLNLSKRLPDKQNLSLGSEQRKFWLKPVGVSEEPVPTGKSYSDMTLMIDFSKRRPAGVEVGDILILYGVGQSKLLSIVEVLTEPRHATLEEIQKGIKRERWPWSVNTKNLSPNYGGSWWLHSLKITELVSEFLKINPNGTITFVGNKSIGGLQFGSDRLRLSKDFADFLIKKVKDIDLY